MRQGVQHVLQADVVSCLHIMCNDLAMIAGHWQLCAHHMWPGRPAPIVISSSMMRALVHMIVQPMRCMMCRLARSIAPWVGSLFFKFSCLRLSWVLRLLPPPRPTRCAPSPFPACAAPAPPLRISASTAAPSAPPPWSTTSAAATHAPPRRAAARFEPASGRLPAGAAPAGAEPGRPCTFQRRRQN